MDGFLKNLHQPEYVHVLLNHLPVTGLFAAWLFLVLAMIIRNRAAKLLGMFLVMLACLSAWPTYVYGEEGYDRVLAMTDNDGGTYLKFHKQEAEKWIYLFYVTAGAAFIFILLDWKAPKSLKFTAPLLALLALGTLFISAYLADIGGKIRHPEFREGPVPKLAPESTGDQPG